MQAKDFMTTPVKTCRDTDTVKDAAHMMWNNKFSVVPIVDKDDNLVGIVTESDFVGKDVEIPHALGSIKGLLGELYMSSGNIEEIYAKAKAKPLSEVMTKNPIYVAPDSSLEVIGNLMARKNLKRLPVVDNGKIAGIITRKDLLNVFLKLN